MCELPGFSPHSDDVRIAGVFTPLRRWVSCRGFGDIDHSFRWACRISRTGRASCRHVASDSVPARPIRALQAAALQGNAARRRGWMDFRRPLRPPHRTQGFIAQGAGIEPAQHSTLRAAAVQRVGPAADQGAFGRRTGGRRGS